MKKYYYDDDGSQGDHWTFLGEFSSDEEALAEGQKLIDKYGIKPCIVYDHEFRTVKEWE